MAKREIRLACARLEDNPIERLRGLYPELAFFFDRAEDVFEENEKKAEWAAYTAMEDRAQEAEWKHTRILDILNHGEGGPKSRLDQIRQILSEE